MGLKSPEMVQEGALKGEGRVVDLGFKRDIVQVHTHPGFRR